jgi:hypothetical protein
LRFFVTFNLPVFVRAGAFLRVRPDANAKKPFKTPRISPFAAQTSRVTQFFQVRYRQLATTKPIATATAARSTGDPYLQKIVSG